MVTMTLPITLLITVTLTGVFGQVFRLPEKEACEKSKFSQFTLLVL